MVTITTPTFANRVVQYPGRYVLNNVSGSTYDLVRSEGTVTVAGTPQNEATFNKIKTDLDNLNTNIGNIETDIGDVNDLDTTSKEVVGAINEVDGHCDTNTTDISNLKTGWLPAGETWTFASVDNPTGVFKVNADVTTKYSPGMRFKFANGGNTIFGICTKVSAYNEIQTGYTHITFLHEINPSNSQALYLMQNSAITNNFVSCSKSPCGFPLSPLKWTIKLIDTTLRRKTSPVAGTFYYSDIGSLNIYIPIGLWDLSFSCLASIYTSPGINQKILVALSTSSSSVSDTELTGVVGGQNPIEALGEINCRKYLDLSSKKQYFVIDKTDNGGVAIIDIQNHLKALKIIATCAYL